MSKFIKLSPFLSQEDRRQLRYHLEKHKHFHKPVKIILETYDSKSKDHLGMYHTINHVIRIDWTQGFKNRYVVILTSKNDGINLYHLYINVMSVKAIKCGRIIPE